MPDIYINHGSLSSANSDLGTAQKTMEDQLQDFIQQMAPHMANVSGELAEAWADVQRSVNTTNERAHGAMNSAVITLSNIHDAHIQGDKQGAAIMGG